MTEWAGDPDEKPGADARMLVGCGKRPDSWAGASVTTLVKHTITPGKIMLMIRSQDQIRYVIV